MRFLLLILASWLASWPLVGPLPGVSFIQADGDVPVTRVTFEWLEWRDRLIQAKHTADRDAAFEALAEAASDPSEARVALGEALTARWQAAMASLQGMGLEHKFERLLAQRTELDQVRKHALDLIEDEQTYFYPYRQPEVTAEKAATYFKVQQEVDQRVRALEGVWNKSLKVKVGKPLAALLEEIEWLDARSNFVKGGLAFPESMPEWMRYLPAGQAQIDLTNLALDRTEARRLLRDRKALAYNEATWAACKLPRRNQTEEEQKQTAQFPNEAEREQVRVTNAYRLMMGRRALTWDPRLQEAAHGHSDYQTRTGNFGHFQEDGPTKTPFDRMRLVGYMRGVSENCSKGSGDPKTAHVGWCHSSGHHRNLIEANHLQMASATSGDVWTQNYGVDTVAESQL
ncbi:MAG TPA: CAP domain-containing protein [Planctomycetota bacterium]|nr:CAP domain-containing protein [Planctomycetota bacterium]HRV79869.1 CAP domain-containing protein [Planctomycetota bacterium]